MSATPNSFPRYKGHKPDCMCITCEFPPRNSPRRLSPSPAQESQCESVAAPAAAVQGEGTLRVMLERGFLNDFHCWLLDNVSEPVSHIEVLMQFKRERGL